MSDSIRGPAALAFVGFLAMVVIGSRGFISGGMPGIATLVPWPSVGDLFDTFGSAWHYTGLGSATPAPPVLALMGGLGAVLFGAVGLARTLLVILAMPVGAIGAYRFTRRLVGLRSPALAAAIAYGVNPVARNAISTGRFGPLVLFALLPFVIGRVVGLAGLDRDVEGEMGDDAATVATPRPRGRFLRLALLVALAAACYPVSPALFVLAAASFVLAAPFARGWSASLRAIGITLLAALASVVLLFPWPLAYATRDVDAASLGFAFRPDLDLSQLLRFQSGPAGAGWVMWGLVVGAAVPLFVATGARLAWATRAWALAVVGWAIVWVPEQVAPDRSLLAPEAGLTLAALGVAVALGIGTSVLVDGVRSMRFGWRQPAAILGAVAILLPALGFTADAFDGRWHTPREGWVDNLAFTDALAAGGEFRILWLGDPSVLPLDPIVLRDGTGYTLTRNGSGDSSELLRAPEQDADHVVDRAVTLAATASRTASVDSSPRPASGGSRCRPPRGPTAVWRQRSCPGGGTRSTGSSTWPGCAPNVVSCCTRTSPGSRSERRWPVRTRPPFHSGRRRRYRPRSAPTSARRPRSRRARPCRPASCCGARPTTARGRRPSRAPRASRATRASSTDARSVGRTGSASPRVGGWRSSSPSSGSAGRSSGPRC